MKKHPTKILIYFVVMFLPIGCNDKIEVIRRNEKDIKNDTAKECSSEKIKEIYQDSFENIKQSKRDADERER